MKIKTPSVWRALKISVILHAETPRSSSLSWFSLRNRFVISLAKGILVSLSIWCYNILTITWLFVLDLSGIVAKVFNKLGPGAIAGIVIAGILIVLIVIDLFCCFFNKCGIFFCCQQALCGGGGGDGKKDDCKSNDFIEELRRSIESFEIVSVLLCYTRYDWYRKPTPLF